MELLKFYFDLFDSLIEKESNSELSQETEKNINEIREKLKNTLDNTVSNYTQFCHTIDKYFDEYIDSKKTN